MLQIVVEGALEIVWHALGEPLQTRDRAHPVLAAIGLVILGGLAGAVTCLIFPTRLFWVGRIPGASLILSPVFTGAAMEYYGRRRRARGGSPSYMATFWGGGLFAFGMALFRFLWVGR